MMKRIAWRLWASLFSGFLASVVPAFPVPPSHPTVPSTIVWRPVVPSSHGDWSQWRGNPQHTGFQSVPGRIGAPAVQWRFRLGGRLQPWQAVVCGTSTVDKSLLISPPGRLSAYSLNGDLLWDRRNALTLTLLGCWDFAGDGRREILAASSGQSGSRLNLFNAQNGDLLWTSPAGPGSVGAVKVVHLSSVPGVQILWLPAAGSRITALALDPGALEPRTLWATELSDFVSDPYTYSSLAIGDLDHDGSQEVVISGGRHSIPTIVLNSATGRELFRKTITVEGHGVESGGASQLLRLDDVAGDGKREILTISSYGSGDAYMFQGITLTSFADPRKDSILDTFPVGLHYVRGSVQDIDGDGRLEIAVSKYVPDLARHDLLILDSATLAVKATVPNFFLKAIIDVPGGPGRLVLGAQDVSLESPSRQLQLTALQYVGNSFRQTSWNPGIGDIAEPLPRAFDSADEDNPGQSVTVLDLAGTDRKAILLFNDRNQDGEPDEIVATDVVSGNAIERWGIAPEVPIELLAIQKASDPAQSRFVIGGADGSLTFLDGRFGLVNAVSVGGYFRGDALNGHSFEIAAVADLAGDGRKEVLVLDSRRRVLKLTNLEEATPLLGPQSEVLWDSGISQELLAVPAAEGGARLVVRGQSEGFPLLRMLEGSGREVWEHVFDVPADIPVGLNWGRLVDTSSADVVASVAGAGGLRRTFALDGRTGETVWSSDLGTYWDGSFAVADVNQDGRDDLVFNYNAWKGFVLDGASGGQLVKPVVLPSYRHLESVDYNGAPIALGPMGGKSFLFLDSEDNAHLALLSVEQKPNDSDPVTATNPWSVEQASPDDERYSMAGVAPLFSDDFVVGLGSQRGNLRAVRGSDGAVLWEIGLWNGAAGPVSDSQPNSLSSVLAMDVNGDGRPDFVVGGADGWLYAVDAASGSLLWSFDLDASVGEPIAADIDGDGSSELLVPTASGYLYAIGPRTRVLGFRF